MKHQWLWRFNFEFTSVKPVSALMFAVRPCHPTSPSHHKHSRALADPPPPAQMYGTLLSRHFAAAFDIYVPDLVVSVHPLMQHIPVRHTSQHATRPQPCLAHPHLLLSSL